MNSCPWRGSRSLFLCWCRLGSASRARHRRIAQSSSCSHSCLRRFFCGALNLICWRQRASQRYGR
jgi:hypothetical protein